MVHTSASSPIDAINDPHDDRIVATVIHEATAGGELACCESTEIADAAAAVLRVIRDDMALAALEGRLPAHPEIERYLNARIGALTGRTTLTGDTTEPGCPGF